MRGQVRGIAGVALVAAALLGCGGGGGGGGSSGGKARAIAGRVTYDKVPTSDHGLDYAATEVRPVRGATVQLLDASSSAVVATAATGDDGAYTLSWPAGGPGQVVVRVLASTATPPVQVEDNTAGGAVWAMVSPALDPASTQTLDLHAPSGWDGSRYGGARVAAPFAVLDAACSAARAFLAERSVDFPPLVLYWSPENRPEAGDASAGQIGTSHWDGQALYILGKEDADTDEYDDHVVVHEWGHYFESRLSRSDSPGGTHALGELKDPRLAWSEGWGNALGAIVLYPDDVYADTGGTGQGQTGLFLSLEDNADSDPNPGWFSESSVMHVLYDLWDPARSEEPFDQVSVGIGRIYDVMTGAQRTTDAFTTLFSFVDGLQQLDPSLAGPISTLLAERGVAGPVHDAFGSGEANDGGMPEALPVYADLASGPFTAQFEPDPEVGNSLAQNRFAAFQGTGAAVQLELSSAARVRLEVFRQGQSVGAVDTTGGSPQSLGGATTAGAIYTVIVTGLEASAGGPYSAEVTLTP